MTKKYIYKESISSKKTETLFLGLMLIFLLLFIWLVNVVGFQPLTIITLCLFLFFLFYVFNYRILHICITMNALSLKFGIFTWAVPFDNVASCVLDDNLPPLMKNGGAGIHFFTFEKRYRASFNFLEYPRVVIALKIPKGPVKDISFSTRQPDEIIQLIQKAISERRQS